MKGYFMNKIKITSHQLFSLTACSAFGGVVLIMPSEIVGIAHQDAWFSAVLATISGLLILKMYCYLGSQYRDMTLTEIIFQVFGKYIGWLITACFFTYCSFISTNIIWNIDSFISAKAMPETPSYLIAALFIAAIVIAIFYGLETIAKTSELFIILASFLFILVMLVSLPNIKTNNLLPVFENGIAGSLKGSIILTDFTSLTLIIILMIYPANVKDLYKSARSIYKGFLWASLLVLICLILNIEVLGVPIAARKQFSTYLLAEEIIIAGTSTRLEFFIAIIWITTFFIVGTLFFYTAVIALSQLLNLKDYKKIILPFGLIILFMTNINFPDTIYQLNWSNVVLLPYDITYAFILPAALLLGSWVKKICGRRSKL
jgi:spore germination protein KB